MRRGQIVVAGTRCIVIAGTICKVTNTHDELSAYRDFVKVETKIDGYTTPELLCIISDMRLATVIEKRAWRSGIYNANHIGIRENGRIFNNQINNDNMLPSVDTGVVGTNLTDDLIIEEFDEDESDDDICDEDNNNSETDDEFEQTTSEFNAGMDAAGNNFLTPREIGNRRGARFQVRATSVSPNIERGGVEYYRAVIGESPFNIDTSESKKSQDEIKKMIKGKDGNKKVIIQNKNNCPF